MNKPKQNLVLFLLSAVMLMSACGRPTAPTAPTAPAAPVTAPPAEIQTSVPVPTSEPTPAPTVPASSPVPTEAPAETDAIDVDLTALSSTMVYGEVYNMLYHPEEYMGKRVKMRGLYSPFESGGAQYFACVVQDATACCAQGLEFTLTEDYRYPDDYPEVGEEITVLGIFDTYQAEFNGSLYVYLVLREARLL